MHETIRVGDMSVTFLKTRHETGGALDLPSYLEEMQKIPDHLHQAHQCRCEFHQGLSRELAFGSAAIMLQNVGAPSKEMQEKLARAHRRGGSIPVIDVMGQLFIGFSEGALRAAVTKARGG